MREKVYSKGKKTAQRRVDLDHLHGRSAPRPLHHAANDNLKWEKKYIYRVISAKFCLDWLTFMRSAFMKLPFFHTFSYFVDGQFYINTVYTDVEAAVFGVLKQWNDSHVGVPRQSWWSWILFLQTLSFLSIDLQRSWTREWKRSVGRDYSCTKNGFESTVNWIATITASYLGLKCACKKFRNFSRVIRKAIFEQWAASERTQMNGPISFMNLRVVSWEVTLRSLTLKVIDGPFAKKKTNLKIFSFFFF